MNQKQREKLRKRLQQHKDDGHDSSKASEIYQKFLLPICRSVIAQTDSEDFTEEDVLDLLFIGRDITTQVAKRKFTLPGGLIVNRNLIDYSYGNREIVRDEKLLVRNDTFQFYVDIERDNGDVFRLSKVQWREIEHHLRFEKLN